VWNFMKEKVDLILVMPIGPNSRAEFIVDSLHSFQYYSNCTYQILLLDDSQKNTGEEISQLISGIKVLPTKKNHGRMAGLYINLCQAYKYALDNYRFDALFKMDDDALIIGENPEAEAIRLFQAQPAIGMAGRHFSGKFCPDFLGTIHDNSYPRNTLLTGTCTWKMIKRPVVNLALRKLLFQAVKQGYEIGENIFGGAYFMSERCLAALHEAGYLPYQKLKRSILGEDHLFSLLIHTAGFKLGDLEKGDLPFGVAWKGLPAAPETLQQHNKKIIHSTRYWQEIKEEEIRHYFRQHRIMKLATA
jgi:hypothetical protein